MSRQCAWCLKVYDFHSQTWKFNDNIRLEEGTHGMCPECCSEMKQQINKKQKNVHEFLSENKQQNDKYYYSIRSGEWKDTQELDKKERAK